MLVICAVIVGAQYAYANPHFFGTSATLGTATTTIAWQTPGTATSTTLVYDAFEQAGLNQTDSGNTNLPDYAIMLWQVNASSTTSVFTAKLEFAEDTPGTNCKTAPTACDWYGDKVSVTATTTNPIDISQMVTYQWAFASSTIGGIGQATGLTGYNGTNNRSTRAVKIPTPTRYTRAVLYVSGTNGGQWAKIIPIKERY